MKPYYYQDEWVTIYHGDCREILPDLPKVDLVLTDPPYGNGTDYGRYVDTRDNLKLPVVDVMPLILGAAKVSLVACGIGNMFEYPKPDWVLCWHWEGGGGSSKWGFNNWQPILAYGGDPYLANRLGRRQDYIQAKPVKEWASIHHPCPKPQGVWSWLIMRGSIVANDTILDPFLGSGTTAYCAKKLNRKCIGIEINEKYCEIAAKRCSQGVFNLGV